MALKSAVFGVVILLLWARSYVVGDVVRKGNAAQYIELDSANGAVITRFGHDGNPTHLEGSWGHVSEDEPLVIKKQRGMAETTWNRIGFGYNKVLIEDPRGIFVAGR